MMDQASALPPTRRVRWEKTYRLIPSRYPPIDLFERVGDPADWETIALIEGLTNDRLRDEVGEIAAVPLLERISGPGASPIMAAFTHIGFESRFTDGTYGVYYASNGFDGALREVLYHKQQFLERTREPKTQFDLRTYIGRIDSDLHDIRGAWPEAHHPTSYASSQGLARTLRASGANGIVYDSVRLPTAANIAVFRPLILASPTGTQHVIQGPHIRAEWDGTRMLRYFIMGELHWISL